MLEIIRTELRKFGESTSMKGVCRTMKAESRVVRMCWLLALMICFGLMLFQVATVAMNYSRYVAIRNTLVSQERPNTPDMTICNLFPVLDMENFTQLYDAYLEKVQLVENQAPEKLKGNSRMWNYFRMLLTFGFNLPLLEIAETRPTVMDGFVVSAREYGWDLFTSQKMKATTVLGSPLQLCKTLQPDTNTAAIDVILFLNRFFPRSVDLYYSWIRVSLSAGVKVMLHPRGIKPDPTTAIFVPPGVELVIDVNQKNYSRLPLPYGACSDRTRVYPDEDNSSPYSRATCFSLCRQRQFIDACGCLDAYEYFTDVELQMGNNMFCQNITKYLEDSPKYVVDDKLTDEFWSVMNCTWFFVPNENLCDCPVSCVETIYEFSSSSAYWPDIFYQLGFYNAYIRNDSRYNKKFSVYEKIRNSTDGTSDAGLLDELQDLKLIERNFIRINAKMGENCTQVVKDIPAITWDTLASNLGGSLNLWVGISLITAAEIVELFYSLMKVAITGKRIDSVAAAACVAVGTKQNLESSNYIEEREEAKFVAVR